MTERTTMRNNTSWLLWFGLFGGLAAWIVHLAVGFVLVYDGCALGFTNVQLLVGVATLVLALLALAAAGSAYQFWRAPQSESSNVPEPAPGRRRFMALLGMWLSSLSFLIILLLAIPALWLTPC